MEVCHGTPETLACSPALPETIAEAGQWLRSGRLSCQALTAAYLSRISELEPGLNAFITLTEEAALATAAARDADLAAGRDLGPLHGIPIVAKDIFDTAGIRTTVGSRIFADRVPTEDASIIKRLGNGGAVLLGKTNMNEFAAGVTGTNRTFGNTHNPWRRGYSPGGSSGGTAAAVAAGYCLGGLATDTGGSIRIPASWCGVAGIRPTPGLVSLEGVYSRTYSLDTAGPMAPTVADLAMLLDAMVDLPETGVTEMRQCSGYTAKLGKGVSGLRLGVVKNYTDKGVDAEVTVAIRRAIETFSDLGAEIVEIEIPSLESGMDHERLFNNVLLYEFNQILGDRYRATPDRENVFDPIVQRNIINGEKVSQQAHGEALKAQAELATGMRRTFTEVDAILTPSLPMVAPPLDAAKEVFARSRHFVLPFTLAQLPSAVIPCGHDSMGLPVGLQITGDCFAEALILRIASAFEASTDYHGRHTV